MFVGTGKRPCSIFRDDLVLLPEIYFTASKSTRAMAKFVIWNQHLQMGTHAINIMSCQVLIFILVFLIFVYHNLESKPKLHLFRQITSYYAVEKYVFDNIHFSLRSCIAQLRFGTLPLTVETGRFTGIMMDEANDSLHICSVAREF